MTRRRQFNPLLLIAVFSFVFIMPLNSVQAQNYVTGAFQGEVTDSVTNAPVPDATVQIINRDTGVPAATRTNSEGRFSHGLLPPGDYIIRVSRQGYKLYETEQALPALRPTPVVPVPVKLTPEIASTTPVATETPGVATAQPTPQATPDTSIDRSSTRETARAELNTTDAQRGGAFDRQEVSTLPLGSITITRSFDELGLLLPGVALPPQTLGSVSGPGVGPGVGSAGQFSVNGLRSRANNFTVDGSDNNDEDIGVRRQGFFSLVPQPVESIQEFQMITLLAPAQYGRNFGAQVNAVSRSGGNETHGTIFGFLNTSQFNARNTFDTAGGNTLVPLRAEGRPVFINNQPGTVRLNTGDKDSFTLGQGGLVLGGPLVPETASRPGRSMFYFISLEGQLLNANKEVNFAVPTITQRGAFRSGATGISVNPLTGAPTFEFPTSVPGDAIFSFFPFPNNLNGVYGANTFTQVVPASAQGKVASGKVDSNFKLGGKQQTFTVRYNFTDDWRDIPVVGGALFSRLRPDVRTQNVSTFLNSEITNNTFNQVRLSYGRTRLRFDEGRDTEFLLPVRRTFNNPDDARFLLNTRFFVNNTLPNNCFTPGVGVCVNFDQFGTRETETSRLDLFGTRLGAVGQIIIAGFSPVGVDVFNFPQARVNNTYQIADTLTIHKGGHSIALGTDIRRTELISDLPRNSRPLLTFNGGPRIIFNPATESLQFAANVPGALNPFIRPEDFAAVGAPSGFFQSLVLPGRDSHINLRYYQLNFFGQDEWRIRPNLSLSFGLRYEYNTPPREAERRIESTFNTSLPTLVSGLSNFINGRTSIFDPDRNNFAPRVGFAYSPALFGPDHATVIRAGYGIYYDQILGAVVSQSRNVFPTFTTVNFGGGCCELLGTGLDEGFNIINPLNSAFGGVPLVVPGTLNTLNPALPQTQWLSNIFRFFPFAIGTPFGATLPSRQFNTPMAHHYGVTFEQQLSRNMVLSAAYVGTQGRDLVRLTTPNLGPNYLIIPVSFNVNGSSFEGGTFSGITVDPGSLTPSATFTNGRPVANIGPIFRYESTATSRYDSLQVQVRGRYHLLADNQIQANYTFGRVNDDVSDVFDLAGAPALPQNSLNFAGERGPANFDVRHRFSSNYISDLSSWGKHNSFLNAVFKGFEVAGTTIFQTGQPFTVNSIFDVNLDGNLTDRPNSTSGIQVTGDRAQPLILTVNPATLLAPIGRDGAVSRNSFRNGNLWVTNAAVIKTFFFTEQTRLVFRTEAFNLFNRANYGIPVRFLEAPGFGRATETLTPGRRIQFALKLMF